MISSSFQLFPDWNSAASAVQVLEERDFDGALKGIEDAADRVDETAPGSVQKKAKDDWTGWEMLFFFWSPFFSLVIQLSMGDFL